MFVRLFTGPDVSSDLASLLLLRPPRSCLPIGALQPPVSGPSLTAPVLPGLLPRRPLSGEPGKGDAGLRGGRIPLLAGPLSTGNLEPQHQVREALDGAHPGKPSEGKGQRAAGDPAPRLLHGSAEAATPKCRLQTSLPTG